MKKRLTALLSLLLCFMFIISAMPMVTFAEDAVEGETTKTLVGTATANGLDNWGTWNGTSHARVEGAAENGVDTASVLTGGSNGGGAQFSLNVGGFVNGSHTFKDEEGNTIATTKGFVDASEFFIRYKSESSFSIKLKSEFRKSGRPTLESKGVWVQSSNGEWATATIPFADFAPSDDVSGKWVQNIYGAYVGNNFDPVVLLRVEQLNQGDSRSMTIDHVGVNWYKEDMASKVEFGIEPKNSYFVNHDDFDYSTGTIKVYRGGSETEYEELTLDDPRVEISGFNNTAIKNNQKITVNLLNKSLTYNVNIIPFAPETLTSIQVNDPKTEYFVGDPFDFATGLIQANYSDKDPEFAQLDDVNATVEGFDSNTAGQQTITVSYGGQTTTYTINVKGFTDDSVTSIKVNNVRKVYQVGDKFNYYDGTVNTYNGSTLKESLKLYNRYITITGFDSSVAAENQEITVTYSGVSTTYTIDILDGNMPVRYYTEMDMTNGNAPALWYNDKCKSEIKAGAGEDGVSGGWYFTGSGTSQAALMGWGSKDETASDGTTVAGLIGADALEIRYKSYGEISFQFRLEYRASKAPTKSTAGAKVPSSNGEWATAIIPMSAFEPSQTGESTDEQLASVEWVHNSIKGGYTTDFEPVVRFYVGVKNGSDQSTTIDSIKGLWYDNFEGVASISVEPNQTKYFNGSELDMTGAATITYKDGTSRTGTMADLGIVCTGFDSNVEENATQTITASYGGKTDTFDVEIITGGDEVASAVLSDGVKAVYLVGDEFDKDSGYITVTLVNGTQTVIPLTDEAVTITGFDSSAQNTNVPVVITYGDYSFDLRVRVFNPRLEYSAAAFTDGNDATITSFGGVDTVKANIKVKNRIACDTPQTAVIMAAVYSYGNKMPVVKRLDSSVVPASTEITLSATFTAEELANATSIKIIALDGAETISELLTAPASINK